MKIILPLVFAIIMISCKNNKSATSSITKNEEVIDSIPEFKIDSNTCRLVIVFYSIGEGSEFPIFNAFEDSIGSYSQKIGKTIDYMKTSWGREGETDFCLKLNELSQTEQEDFISKTRLQLKIAKWVHIYENYPCPPRRRR